MFISIEASLFLTREFPQDESIKDEDVMYSFSTYIAEKCRIAKFGRRRKGIRSW